MRREESRGIDEGGLEVMGRSAGDWGSGGVFWADMVDGDANVVKKIAEM